MYGGFQCSHCMSQKAAFGPEAFARITYVECDARSPSARRDLCEAAGIRSYPTWILGDRRLEGEQALATLADFSGYEGPRDFRVTHDPHDHSGHGH
jgi:hypothetical protein